MLHRIVNLAQSERSVRSRHRVEQSRKDSPAARRVAVVPRLRQLRQQGQADRLAIGRVGASRRNRVHAQIASCRGGGNHFHDLAHLLEEAGEAPEAVRTFVETRGQRAAQHGLDLGAEQAVGIVPQDLGELRAHLPDALHARRLHRRRERLVAQESVAQG